MPPAPVIIVGDIVTDILAVHSGAVAVGSDTAASISLTGGGSAANTAAWLAAAGVAVELVGVVGRDPAGDARVAELTAAGVSCRFVTRTGVVPTGTVIVLADGDDRSFLCDRGANLHLSPSDVDKSLAATLNDVRTGNEGHLHLSGYTLLDAASRPAGRHALAAARDRGRSTSVDAASAAPLRRSAGFLDWIRGVDLLFANLDEARVLADRPTGEPTELVAALRSAATHVVIKLGPRGAVWAGPTGVLAEPAVPAQVVDPTGAGDAFAAGFLAAWLGGEAPASVLRRAVASGAAAVETLGGRPVSPR